MYHVKTYPQNDRVLFRFTLSIFNSTEYLHGVGKFKRKGFIVKKLFKTAVQYGKKACAYIGKTGRALAIGVGAALGLSGSLQAVPEVVPFTAIDIDYATLAGQILTAFTAIVVVGIGIGFAIWVFRRGLQMFKSTARG